MRLFGTPGGSLNKARSTYGFMSPFDLSLVYTEPNNGFVLLFDFQQPTMAGGIITYPDWAYAIIPKQNPLNIQIYVDGNNTSAMRITANAGPYLSYINTPQILTTDGNIQYEQGADGDVRREVKSIKGNNTNTSNITGKVGN